MTTSLNSAVLNLGSQYPEWQPWLTVIKEVLREATEPKWEAWLAEPPKRQENKIPLLAGATLVGDVSMVGYWWERLVRAAYKSGAPKMSMLNRIQHGRMNTVDLFQSSLCQNIQWFREAAVGLDADAEALQAVALLLPVPFLQACNRRWASSITESWTEGYCPVCGAWPAFAEVRGIERSRYLRCGRCGGGWQARCLSCSYCGMTDHDELVSLVPENAGSNAVIDACKRCLGYVKTFTKLQGSDPAGVMVDDLASVDLDIAALEQGYRRPEGAGYPLDIKILSKAGFSERIFSWLT